MIFRLEMMDKIELKKTLDSFGVDPRTYSLDRELIPDSIILRNSYHTWEVFYLDEKGGRNNEKVFTSEQEACLHIYSLLKEAKEIEDKFLQ